jgi:putative spermidine/putrescine transport system ATP-binding protein
VGTPTEVYDKPATKYVASFIGDMNFLDRDNKTIAIRPEEVKILRGFKEGSINGTVRTIMILGHYVAVNIQRGEDVLKSFMPRTELLDLKVGDKVHVEFGKTLEFPAEDS